MVDSSQDVLWDWKYRHPGEPRKSEALESQITKDSYHFIDDEETGRHFLDILHRKSREVLASRLIFYYSLGFQWAILSKFRLNELTEAELIQLGKELCLATASDKQWKAFLNRLPVGV